MLRSGSSFYRIPPETVWETGWRGRPETAVAKDREMRTAVQKGCTEGQLEEQTHRPQLDVEEEKKC